MPIRQRVCQHPRSAFQRRDAAAALLWVSAGARGPRPRQNHVLITRTRPVFLTTRLCTFGELISDAVFKKDTMSPAGLGTQTADDSELGVLLPL